MAGKKQDTRARAWTLVVYPESAPKDWRSVLDEDHMPWIESPLHDKDTNPDGEIKKAHWHVLLLFAGVKSYSQVKVIAGRLHAPNPQKCADIRGMVRYFVHMDNPEKYQYSKADIQTHGGADIAKYLSATGAEKLQMIAEMQDWVVENHCTELSELAEYARRERFDDWYGILSTQSTIFLNAFIRSKRHQGGYGKGEKS